MATTVLDQSKLLKLQAMVDKETKYKPCESRQTGWILQNCSMFCMFCPGMCNCDITTKQRTYTHKKKQIKNIIANSNLTLNCTLNTVGGNKNEIKIKSETVYNLDVNPNETIYILVDVIAPPIPGKYNTFFQLQLPDSRPVGPLLELSIQVEKEFNQVLLQSVFEFYCKFFQIVNRLA